MFKNDRQLEEKFKKSGKTSRYTFLLEDGYLAGTDSNRYKEIAYIPYAITEKGRQVLVYYYEEGFKLIDISKEYGIER